MRVIVPVLEQNDKRSRISPHFGRAPYLAVVEVADGEIKALQFVQGEGPHEENRTEEEKTKAATIHDTIRDIKPDVIIATRIGPRAVEYFTRAGIKILPIEGDSLSDVISKVKNHIH